MTNPNHSRAADAAAPVQREGKPVLDRREFIDTVAKTVTGVAAMGSGLIPDASAAPARAAPVAYIEKGAEGYERARLNAVWNSHKPGRYPDRIAFIQSPAQAAQAVRDAARQQWKVAVRGGGHNWIGNHVRDGGLMLDMSRQSKIEFNERTRIVAIEPGVRARDLQKVLNDKGYRIPTATCPTVGVTGNLLGGGASFTTRLDGPSCHYVEAADVVLADGSLVHATDKTHPEIMWALRGAGPGFFGVVTKMYVHALPLHKAMMSSFYLFNTETMGEFFDWYLSVYKNLPTTLQHTVFAVKGLAPQFPGIPLAISVIALGDSEKDCRDQLSIFEKAPFVAHCMAHVPPVPWTHDIGYALVDKLYPKSFHFRSETLWVDPFKEGFMPLMYDSIKTLDTLHSHILWAPYGGHHTHPNSCHTLHGELSLHFYGVADTAEDDKHTRPWVNTWMDKFRPFSEYNGAGKINDNGLDEFPKYYLTPENTDKLEVLRKKYDPNGVFHAAFGTPRAPAKRT